jgi:hypothetical protein
MRQWLFSAAAVAALALILSSAAVAQPAPTRSPPPAEQAIAADTPQATQFGVSFMLPKDWKLRRGPGWVDALPPEGDSDIVIVDGGEARTGLRRPPRRERCSGLPACSARSF